MQMRRSEANADRNWAIIKERVSSSFQKRRKREGVRIDKSKGKTVAKSGPLRGAKKEEGNKLGAKTWKNRQKVREK